MPPGAETVAVSVTTEWTMIDYQPGKLICRKTVFELIKNEFITDFITEFITDFSDFFQRISASIDDEHESHCERNEATKNTFDGLTDPTQSKARSKSLGVMLAASCMQNTVRMSLSSCVMGTMSGFLENQQH